MSYYREIRHDELVEWLTDNVLRSFTEDDMTMDELATTLLNKFDILGSSNTAQ